MRKLSFVLFCLLTLNTLAVAKVLDVNDLDVQNITRMDCEAIPMLERAQTTIFQQAGNNHPNFPENYTYVAKFFA